jgi:hypothetical protein
LVPLKIPKVSLWCGRKLLYQDEDDDYGYYYIYKYIRSHWLDYRIKCYELEWLEDQKKKLKGKRAKHHTQIIDKCFGGRLFVLSCDAIILTKSLLNPFCHTLSLHTEKRTIVHFHGINNRFFPSPHLASLLLQCTPIAEKREGARKAGA